MRYEFQPDQIYLIRGVREYIGRVKHDGAEAVLIEDAADVYYFQDAQRGMSMMVNILGEWWLPNLDGMAIARLAPRSPMRVTYEQALKAWKNEPALIHVPKRKVE